MSTSSLDNGTNDVTKRKTRTSRSKVEQKLVFVVFVTAISLVFINIYLVVTWTIEEPADHHGVEKTFKGRKIDRNHVTMVDGATKNVHGAKNPMQTKNNNTAIASADAGYQIMKEKYTVDERLMRILRHVGIQNASQLSEDDRRLLPTWDEVVDRVGNDGPRILGLETCKAYRSQVSSQKRMLGVAGPFNSGTHLLHELLMNNCMYVSRIKKGKKKNEGVLDQVPWGKHQSPRFRLLHNTQLGRNIDKANDKLKDKDGKLDHPELPPRLREYNEDVLPIVMVRDPFTWWQSMCKSRYSAHWYHVVPDHCPNFIPNNVEKEWFFKRKIDVREHYDGDPWKIDNVIEKANYTLDKTVIPLWVRYHSENWHHKSLAHMWTDWYKDYYDVDYPRLMIRLEDLVFYPHETLGQVCECVIGEDEKDHAESGYFEYIGDENLILSLDSAIRGSGKGVDNIHGKERAGLLAAMAKHAGPHSVSHRVKGITKEDLEFAIKVLGDSETMSYFGYKAPLKNHLENNRNNTTR